MKLFSVLSLILITNLAYSQSISGISPNSADDGETLNVSISGLNTNFSQATNTVVTFYFDSGTSTITSPNSFTINNNQSILYLYS